MYKRQLIGSRGISPLPSRVDDLKKFPSPISKLGLQRFLGMLNYYRRFVPGLARVLAPLHQAVASATTPKKFRWTPQCEEAFSSAKSKLATATLLHHPSPFAETAITVDASDIAVGAELSQRSKGGDWKPLAFFSRSLSTAERKYSAFDRELLAIFLTIKHFRHFLEGKKFSVYTDHKPLTFALSSSTDRSPRQTRHLSFIAEFTSDIRHVKGSLNTVADALSRPAINVIDVPSLDFQALAKAQLPDQAEGTSLKMEDVVWNGIKLSCDVSTGVVRPFVPPSFRRKVFTALHSLSHPGPKPSTRLITTRFVWPDMKRDIRRWCAECHPCQAAKISRHVKTSVVLLPPAQRRFGSVHVDLVGPLPSSQDYRYLLTVVDRFSRWPEAFPLKNITAASCCGAFLRGWISRFGVPDELVTDRGAQFTGSTWKEFISGLGIATSTTTSYHPQANGMVERMHRQLKAALKARLTSNDWMEDLPLVLLGLRSAWREAADTSPAEILYGVSVRLPGQFVPGGEDGTDSRDSFAAMMFQKMQALRPVPSKHHGSSVSTYLPSSLLQAKTVSLVRELNRCRRLWS